MANCVRKPRRRQLSLTWLFVVVTITAVMSICGRHTGDILGGILMGSLVCCGLGIAAAMVLQHFNGAAAAKAIEFAFYMTYISVGVVSIGTIGVLLAD